MGFSTDLTLPSWRSAGPQKAVETSGSRLHFLEESQNLPKITEGAPFVAGSARTQVVVQVVDISDGIVHVRPLPGSVASHRSLLGTMA